MRRKLIAGRLTAVLLAALIAVAGCSGASPLTGTSTPAAAGSAAPAGTVSAPVGPSSQGPSSADGPGATGSGLSAACDATLRAQVVIATLFTAPVDGHELSTADVAKAFGKVGADIPDDLQDDVATLHAAAERAVGKSAGDVAAILAEPEVSSAQGALATFVRGCSPATS